MCFLCQLFDYTFTYLLISLCKFYWFWVYMLFYRMLVISLFFYRVNIIFWWNRRSDGFLHHIMFCFTFFVYHVNIAFFDNHVSSSDQWLFGIIQIPTCFSNLLTRIIRFIRQWVTDIGWHYFSAWYSPTCQLYNQFQLLIVLPKIKALREGSQQLYYKNATSQVLFLIQRRTGYRTK